MTDKLKLFMGLSTLSIVISLYQIVTNTYSVGRTFLIIYCVLVVLFNRDKSISNDKIARLVVILTLVLLFAVAFLKR